MVVDMVSSSVTVMLHGDDIVVRGDEVVVKCYVEE